MAVRCQRHSDNHTPNHTGRVILLITLLFSDTGVYYPFLLFSRVLFDLFPIFIIYGSCGDVRITETPVYRHCVTSIVHPRTAGQLH